VNYGPLIFLAAFFALSGSWLGFVVAPHFQLGSMQQTNTVGGGLTYPLARAGLAQQGLQVYRANGCATCHSQLVTQDRTIREVVLTDPGTNSGALVLALRKLNPNYSDEAIDALLKHLPKTVLFDVAKPRADEAVKDLNQTSAKARVVITPTGPDIARGWGKRRSVAEDYLYDAPTLPGSQRVGPDLANIGIRKPDVNWHLRHLYAPESEVPRSTMPPYRFLFEARKTGRVPSADALQLASGAVPPGIEVVPRAEAMALATYLASLQANGALFSTPLSSAPTVAAPAPTNSAPTGATNTPFNAPATK
jgi:cbb3-type cytochrome oxidase cytochrome c subunit